MCIETKTKTLSLHRDETWRAVPMLFTVSYQGKTLGRRLNEYEVSLMAKDMGFTHFKLFDEDGDFTKGLFADWAG